MQYAIRLKALISKTLHSLLRKYNHFLFGRCTVLLYHRVAELETDPQLLAVSPSNFADHIRYLNSNFRILDIDEFKDHLFNRKRFPHGSILLTFDDGYADNYFNAMPVLEKENVQALFYISTCNLNTTREFWWDEVERIVLLTTQLPEKLELKIGNKKMVFNTKDKQDILQTYNSLLSLLKVQSASVRKECIEFLEGWSGNNKPRESHRLLTFSELKAFAASKSVIIGAHTHNHQSLAALNRQEQLDEIRVSKNILEEVLMKSIQDFAYPFGTKNDYNNDTINICRELGFTMVSSNFPKSANTRTSHFEIPRFLVRNWSKEELAGKLKQFLSQ